MTINLTPAELREFVKVWESDDDAVLNAASERIEEFIREIDKDVLAILSTLALALADAMEERDRLRDLLHRVDPERVDLAGSEQSWERQSEELSQTVLRVAEQRDKALADLEAAREFARFSTYISVDGAARYCDTLDEVESRFEETVRAAWEGK